ncbi:MAG TPA: glycosyltransferase [Bacteroidales bacterium]|nr:glycosyltransferase [Bacteroidales bacterium]HCI55303.1 glycosyltransferase [Bacteroidales bacterium]HOU95405.1 glycosyltransferase [Bacteroidales bacterium]HQG36316.1 glycosyltransferase [Bacteroidales bacterium]HQG52500.1 glycosyltransferase [Bacteroidales bacterium]
MNILTCEENNRDTYPLISIILISLNSVRTIELCLQSIITLDYPSIELIVVDGESTDGTIEILRKYDSKIDNLIIEKDSGIYDAMNKGAKSASGDFLYFTGADDVIVNSWKNLTGKLKPGNTVYYGNAYFPVLNRIYNGKFSRTEMLFRNICQQAIFYPASVFKKYMFSDRYPFMADYHLNLILRSDKEFRFKYIELLVAIFSERGVSSKLMDYEFQKERGKIIRQNFSYFFYIVFIFGMTLKKWFWKSRNKKI